MEEFALAQDRDQFLRTLIPATEEHDYFHCLHHQHHGRLEEVDKILPTWRKRTGETPRWHEINNRQELLAYDEDPDRTLKYLRKKLALRFNHQRKAAGRKTRHKTRLDPSLLSRDARKARALKASRHNSLDGFTDRALDRLLDEGFEGLRLRTLLGRLSRPDHPKLVDLIARDLQYKKTGGFGSSSAKKKAR